MQATTGPDGASVPPSVPTLAALPWRRLLALLIGSRLLIWVCAGVSLLCVAKGKYYVEHRSPIEWMVRWDAASFLEIADHGYASPPGAKPNFPFLPLYPLLVRACSLGGVMNLPLVSQAVSIACLWVSCVLLWRIVVRERGDPKAARLAVAFLLFGPVSFFFSAPYSEALFLALALGCFDCLRRDRWWAAALLGALATLTRFAGLMLIVPLCWQALENAWRTRPNSWPKPAVLVACAAPLLGFMAYCGFLWVCYGDPLLYFHVELRSWGRCFAWFWLFLAHESFSGLPVFYQVWFAGSLVTAFVLLLATVGYRLPTAYPLYGLALISLYISSRLAEALPRYLSVIFPLYIAAALICRKWPRLALPALVTSALLEALSVTLFVNGYWFT